MAREYNLAEIRRRAKVLSDMVNDEFVADADWNDFINANLCEVYDLLCAAGAPQYYNSTTSITTVNGTLSYALPQDFRSATCVYGVLSTDRRVPVQQLEDYELVSYRTPTSSQVMLLEYVKSPPVLEDDADTFDGVSGWEELIVSMSARDALIKEESDVSAVQQKINELRGRITSKSRTRGTGSRKIRDVDLARRGWYPGVNAIKGCRIRGDNIEFYETSYPYF